MKKAIIIIAMFVIAPLQAAEDYNDLKKQINQIDKQIRELKAKRKQLEIKAEEAKPKEVFTERDMKAVHAGYNKTETRLQRNVYRDEHIKTKNGHFYEGSSIITGVEKGHKHKYAIHCSTSHDRNSSKKSKINWAFLLYTNDPVALKLKKGKKISFKGAIKNLMVSSRRISMVLTDVKVD